MKNDEILIYFPEKLRNEIKENISFDELNILEEIRIRNNLPIILKIGQAEKILDYKIKTEEINYIFQKICENSIYTYQKEIANGFITLKGGNRVGLVGSAVLNQEGKVINLNYISSLNFRISRQIIGCSNEIIDEIYKKNGEIYNTLIVSKPGMGKTTLLRDIIRNISNGIENKYNGLNVAVVDERGEISGTFKGIMGNDLGIRTDVINDISKDIGMRMMIRSMAPKVIVADEIGNIKDTDAIKYAMCSGVKGIFTAHGDSIEDIRKNKEISELVDNKIIEKVIIIKNRNNGKYQWEII